MYMTSLVSDLLSCLLTFMMHTLGPYKYLVRYRQVYSLICLMTMKQRGTLPATVKGLFLQCRVDVKLK